MDAETLWAGLKDALTVRIMAALDVHGKEGDDDDQPDWGCEKP
jgi:hypothetical protein